MAFYERPDGCRLYHEVHGDAAAPPLILLEGMGGDVPGWRRSIPRLAERLRVVAYDFRGNGRSDAPDDPATMATFVEDTVGLLAHLRIERAHLYGQSFGAMVALELAFTHPERVRSLILAATHAGRKGAIRSTERAPKGRPWELLYALGFPEAHPEHVEDDVAHGSEQARHARRLQWAAIQEWDAHDRLSDVRVPTLVLHGTEDRMIHPENARVLANGIPGARLVLLEGAGHVYHSEQPEKSDRAVLDFVLEVERRD